MLPHGLAHGDASPANLHEPGDGTVVALDWSCGSSGAVGSDLAQLVAGRFESGVAEPDDLPAIADAVFDGFTQGLADESVVAAPSDLRLAWATHLAVRSAFSAVLVDRPDLDDGGRVDPIWRRVEEQLQRRRGAVFLVVTAHDRMAAQAGDVDGCPGRRR